MLAVHGLNDVASDGDFLALAELSAAEETLDPGSGSFFTTATPGDYNNAGFPGVSGIPFFSQMPQIAECAVIGLPDEQWGEKPVAIVALNPGESLDYETLEKHCRKHLGGFKVPKDLQVRDALPRNPSGKVLKRVLRDQFADQ